MFEATGIIIVADIWFLIEKFAADSFKGFEKGLRINEDFTSEIRSVV